MAKSLRPWAIYDRDGKLVFLGLSPSERGAWDGAFQWPSDDEIEKFKQQGMRARAVKVTPTHGEMVLSMMGKDELD